MWREIPPLIAQFSPRSSNSICAQILVQGAKGRENVATSPLQIKSHAFKIIAGVHQRASASRTQTR
jgi:hypothetical protein